MARLGSLLTPRGAVDNTFLQDVYVDCFWGADRQERHNHHTSLAPSTERTFHDGYIHVLMPKLIHIAPGLLITQICARPSSSAERLLSSLLRRVSYAG